MLRLNKKWRFISITVLVAVFVTAAIFAAIWITHTQSAELGNALARCQRHNPRHHMATIKNALVNPDKTEAAICDTLTITNGDNRVRRITFGKPGQELTYDGISKSQLFAGQSLTVTLVRPGKFQFYDKNDTTVMGAFTVSGKLGPN